MHSLVTAFLLFSTLAHAEISAEHLQDKLQRRSAIIAAAKPKYSANKEASNLSAPAYFLASDAGFLVTDVYSLERYKTVLSSSMMWTGFFWPNYLGGLGFRYQDTNFPRHDWGRARDYVRAQPSTATPNELLSPAEKYDLVMGVSPEEEGSLTSRQWLLGQDEYQRTGSVEKWQGICHGWAPAAINLPVPRRSVVFPTRRGSITFTPEDIKALGSLLYANGRYESSYTGVRCNSNTPERDRSGRVLTAECFDINPADWHIILTHHLGIGKRPFVIDIVNSTEVWNKPVIGYNYTYLNIRNDVSCNTIRAAVVPIEEARGLRLGTYRNPNTVYVLGINMTITYLDGGFVRNNMNNAKDMQLIYDLELDGNYRIIGGEWRSEIHPDFAWKPRFATLPTTEGDAQTLTLRPWEAAMNPAWRSAALSSATHNAPLTKFVKYLFDTSGAL